MNTVYILRLDAGQIWHFQVTILLRERVFLTHALYPSKLEGLKIEKTATRKNGVERLPKRVLIRSEGGGKLRRGLAFLSLSAWVRAKLSPK